MNHKNPIGIVHHLHRTGGTLISRCIASLKGISLLSEVNPGTTAEQAWLDPVFQASFWLRLMDDEEANELALLDFATKIERIWERASARHDRLVLRDWSYIDFFGRPFLEQPSNELSLGNTLTDTLPLRQIVTLRHPLDQWSSWCGYKGWAQAGAYTLEEFLAGVRRFHAATHHLPRLKYEDFVADPRQAMGWICDALQLNYSDIFMSRWPHYHQITGDDFDWSAGDWKIKPRLRRTPPDDVLKRIQGNADYQYLCEQWAYEP
jgi:hypothetical protein